MATTAGVERGRFRSWLLEGLSDMARHQHQQPGTEGRPRPSTRASAGGG